MPGNLGPAAARPTEVKRAALFVPIVLAAFLAVPAGRAWACSCVATDLVQALERADVVLRGTVLGREDPDGIGPLVNSGRTVTYEVDVAEVFKGSVARTTYVRSAASGASCGIEVAPGREYVVFAKAQGSALKATLCDGTAPATPALVEEVVAIAGPGTPATVPASPQLPGATAPGPGGALWIAVGSAILVLLLAAATGWLVWRRAPLR